MKFLRYLLPVAALTVGFSAASAFAAPLGCSNDSFHNEANQRDFEAVQEFVNSKRTIPLEEKDCNLSIAGDIRFDWAHIVEKLNGGKLRGNRGTAIQNQNTGDVTLGGPDVNPNFIPFSTNAFDVEFNLYFDYICDRSWGVAWLQFDEDGGIQQSSKTVGQDPQGLFGSGCCGDLCLKKAYMGYNLCADGCSRFDVELGRRPLYTVFDSRIQFQSNFDGVLLRYSHSADCWGDFYVNAGAFVVDERADHYAWVIETGLLDTYCTGLDIKYSYIDWKSLLSHDTNRAREDGINPKGTAYRVSQISADYKFNADYLCMPAKIYGAFLINSAASPTPAASSEGISSKDDMAWYAGMIIGEVCREGDWSFDFNYQYVEALAIPDLDVSGIGKNGNNLLDLTTSADGLGFTNYKGWRFEGLYALTDNLSLDASFEFSKQIKKLNTLGKHSYSKFELQAIYAF